MTYRSYKSPSLTFLDLSLTTQQLYSASASLASLLVSDSTRHVSTSGSFHSLLPQSPLLNMNGLLSPLRLCSNVTLTIICSLAPPILILLLCFVSFQNTYHLLIYLIIYLLCCFIFCLSLTSLECKLHEVGDNPLAVCLLKSPR